MPVGYLFFARFVVYLYLAFYAHVEVLSLSMEERISKIGRNQGNLTFSESKIELTLDPEEIAEGYFEIECSEGCTMEGYVYSSSVRMQLGVTNINGTKAAVPYEFNAEGMRPGDVLKGSFMIVSNLGEYVLPFVASVNLSTLESSMGSIRNLFHFTNLAKSNWEEAVRIFYRPEFIDIMTGQDAAYRNLYKGLSGRGNKNHNLEEFLIGINKKKMIEYSVAESSVSVADTGESHSEYIEIAKNGWGYTLLAAKVEGDYISIPNNRIKGDDFSDGICRFEYFIDHTKLHQGKNPGRIIFKHLYGQFVVDITVISGTYNRKQGRLHRLKTTQYSLVRHYIDYRIGILDKNKWIALTDELVAHRATMDSEDIDVLLFEAYLLLEQEKYNEAKWILDRKVKPYIEDSSDEAYCLYLYLNALYSADDYYMREVNEKIVGIYESDPDNYRIAWIILHTSDEFKRNPSRMYAFAIKQLARGCSSPLIYIEAVKMLHAMPSLLMHFDEEEMRMLTFAARNKIVSTELREQIAYQAMRIRDYDFRIVRILKLLYESNPTDDVLQAICTQLIRGDKIGSKYFEWYEKGVQKGFSVTRLYESYIMSAADKADITIPIPVLMYFSYDNNLPYEQAAYLYAYVVRNKAAIPDIYINYKSNIDRFVLKQLYSEKISRDLAYLYTTLVVGEMATEDNLRQLSGLLLKHLIRVDDTSVVSAVVIDERLKEEMVYQVLNGKALIDLPSNEYTVFLEDALGNRYYGTKEYMTERFFLPRKLVPVVEPYADNDLLFNLYVCEGNIEYVNVNERNADRYLYLEQSEDVSDEFRSSIRLPLIRYYQDNDETAMLDGLLDRICKEEVPVKDRDELLRIFLMRGFIDKAYEYVLYYGPESTDPQILVRLAAMISERDGLAPDEKFTAIVMSAFDRGKYNETCLRYLVEFYRGPLKHLRNIWKAASGFYVDTYKICEAMIAQTLTTGAYIGEEARILKEYVEGGAKTGLEIDYLKYFADGYLISDRIIDEYFFTEMARIYENEHSLPTVCMLAFLKFYAKNVRLADISDTTAEHIRRYIYTLYAKEGIVMPFMQAFSAISAESEEISKLTVIEYRGEPDARVTINYFISSENDESEGYIRDEMKEVYDGIYSKSFLIFFGETLQYYITEESDGIEELTESASASKNDVNSSDSEDRYGMINDISMATTLKDYDTALQLVSDYKKKLFYAEHLFSIQ